MASRMFFTMWKRSAICRACGAPSCALGERTAAIAADDLDTRMLLEPICCHAGGTLRKKVDNLPLFQVHDDGPVSRALAPCPIVDAHDSRFPFGAARLHPSLETAQNRIVAHRHADSLD